MYSYDDRIKAVKLYFKYGGKTATVLREFPRLGEAVRQLDARFHALVVRRRRWAMELPDGKRIKAGEVALALEHGIAAGRPIRALGGCCIDTKFIERNRTLLCQILDLRFDGLATEIWIEASWVHTTSTSDGSWSRCGQPAYCLSSTTRSGQ